jgi:hypothetical protein
MVRAARGSMTIVSKPEGAEVYFDGRRVGTTPLSLNDLLLGEHYIVVRHPGHHRFSARVVVSKERVDRTEVFLRALPPQQSPVVRLVEGARKGALDRNTATDVLQQQSARALVIVLAGEPTRAIYFDAKNGERAAQGSSFDALAKSLKNALAAPAAPLAEQPREKKPDKIDKPPQQQAERPIEIKPAVDTRKDVHPVVALLPAGIGQFMEGRYGWGAFFLTTQVLLLTANIVSYFLVQADKVPNTSPPEFRNPQRSEAFKWVSNVGFGLLIADVIAGGIDGILHRKAER